jgi:GNAT superfamily N-acetyltransferase
MGRVVGDGAAYFYLQDVVVLPEFQRQGIGTAIVEKLLQYLGDSVAPGAFVGLFAADGAAQFYESFGFVRRDAERPGMQWTR